MEQSPLSLDDLRTILIPAGASVFCGLCGMPCKVQVDIRIAPDEVIICRSCESEKRGV